MEELLNNSKGINAIVRGVNGEVKVKKRVFKYTLQEKRSMLTEFDNSPPARGKLKRYAIKYDVDERFFAKARKTMGSLENKTYKNKLMVRTNGMALQTVSVDRKTLGLGRKVRYDKEEDWLYSQFLLYEAHEIPTSTTLLIALFQAKFPHIEQSDNQWYQFIYRWESRYGVDARRVSHSHDKDEQNIGQIRVDFTNSYHSLVSDYAIKTNLIVNMDETAVDLSEAITTVLACK